MKQGHTITMTKSLLSRQHLTNLPNILTYIRMAIIPVIVVLLSRGSFNTALIFFIVASITDYLDGILARKYDLVTSLGKLLDPLADKLLTSAVLIMLIGLKVQGWLVFLIIGRDIVITGLRTVAAAQGLIINASRMGKNKMVSQTVALILLLSDIPSIQPVLDSAGLVFLWISLILGYWSARDYFVYFFREIVLRRGKK